MTAIVEAPDKTAISPPNDAGNARVSRSGGLPLRGALTCYGSENLIDYSGVSDDKDALTRMHTGDRIHGPHDTSPESTVSLATGPREVLVRLGFILKPRFWILLAHFGYGKSIYGSAIDFGETSEDTNGVAETFGRGLCSFNGSREWTDAKSVKMAFRDKPATEQRDLPLPSLA